MAQVVVSQTATRLGILRRPVTLRVLSPFVWFFGLNREVGEVAKEGDESKRGDWTARIALAASVGLLMAALSANASRSGCLWAVPCFYFSISIIYLPTMTILVQPGVSRRQRIALLLIVTAALFLVKVVRAPIAFVDHDEFLHWVTASNIIAQGRLFDPNPLLPVSSSFPGLEIVTTAIAELSGLSIFAAATALLAVSRLMFISALFLIYEKTTRSSRIASIGCAIYMGCSTFLIFDAHFAYESLAVVLLVLAVYSDAVADALADKSALVTAMFTLPLLAALAVTHHMTAFFAAGLFFGLMALKALRSPTVPLIGKSIAVALLAVCMPLLWSYAMGNPTSGYLGPVLQDGIRELTQLLSPSAAPARHLFESDDGSLAPLWQRSAGIASVLLICIGLASGFIRSLSLAGLSTSLRSLRLAELRRWTESRLLLFATLTLAYPLSVLFRLTRSGWEIGNRIGPFSFLGVSLVVAVGLATFWQSRSKSAIRATVLATAATLIVVGGVISGEGPRVLVPAQFQVSADSSSIEPMGIAAARWTQEWLGPGNVFASDRINRLLLSTYGQQQVTTTLQDGRDASVVFQTEALSQADIDVLRQLRVRYLLADLRLSTDLPAVGTYFDGGISDQFHSRPLSIKALLKFNAQQGVSRVFDDGFHIAFDVGNLDGTR